MAPGVSTRTTWIRREDRDGSWQTIASLNGPPRNEPSTIVQDKTGGKGLVVNAADVQTEEFIIMAGKAEFAMPLDVSRTMLALEPYNHSHSVFYITEIFSCRKVHQVRVRRRGLSAHLARPWPMVSVQQMYLLRIPDPKAASTQAS